MTEFNARIRRAQPLPSVVGVPFLARDGLMGYRCEECLYVVTGRTPEAVDSAIRDHFRYVHLLQGKPSVQTDDDEPF